MTFPLRVQIAVEGYLDEQVLRRLLACVRPDIAPPTVCHGLHGEAHLWRSVPSYYRACLSNQGITPFVILADLDNRKCSSLLIKQHIRHYHKIDNCLIRIAVCEIESWLLADAEALSQYLGVSASKIPQNTDALSDPKTYLINLARRGRNKRVCGDILPGNGHRQIGAGYNDRLSEYVSVCWHPEVAQQRSKSLSRAIAALRGFCPMRNDS